jgi:hypothetical protein
MTRDTYYGYNFNCWDYQVYPKNSPEPSLEFPYYMQFLEQYKVAENSNNYFSSDDILMDFDDWLEMNYSEEVPHISLVYEDKANNNSWTGLVFYEKIELGSDRIYCTITLKDNIYEVTENNEDGSVGALLYSFPAYSESFWKIEEEVTTVTNATAYVPVKANTTAKITQNTEKGNDYIIPSLIIGGSILLLGCIIIFTIKSTKK